VTDLLRAPPFPAADASVTRSAGPTGSDLPLAELFARIRTARIGGHFWAEPAAVAGGVITPSDVDPWSVLPGAEVLRASGDDEWVALARIAGTRVELTAPGRFGSPGDDPDQIDRRVGEALTGTAYRDPFTGGPATLEATIDLLAEWRRLLDANAGIVAASGMAWWKRREIRQFLWTPRHRLRLMSRPHRALALARRQAGALAIWPSRVSPGLLAEARDHSVPLVRVEDGFLRSVGLGSNLVPPSSIVADRRGIHFDPRGPSDLEAILAGTTFAPQLLDRARRLRETIIAAGISKYAAGSAGAVPERPTGTRVVLVPAQVEDDMSVLAGGGGLHSNLELLRRARALEPHAQIWFRPHPDVDAGHRKGAVPDETALQLADRVVRGGGMAPLLDAVDAVHVLTSLTGFEALMRGREVICHGTPFYAGWGLTRDLGAVPDRRGRALALDELVAGTLILYPRYLDPVTGLPCPPEVLVDRMATHQAPNRLRWIAPLRQWQGQLMARLRRR
jgi:capsular polysaccharide export protein